MYYWQYCFIYFLFDCCVFDVNSDFCRVKVGVEDGQVEGEQWGGSDLQCQVEYQYVKYGEGYGGVDDFVGVKVFYQLC